MTGPHNFTESAVAWIGAAGAIVTAAISLLERFEKLPPWASHAVSGFFRKRTRQQPPPVTVVAAAVDAELRDMRRLMKEQDERHEADLRDERTRNDAERKGLAEVQRRQQGQIDYLWTALGSLRQYAHRAHGEIIRLNPGSDFPAPPHIDPPPWQ